MLVPIVRILLALILLSFPLVSLLLAMLEKLVTTFCYMSSQILRLLLALFLLSFLLVPLQILLALLVPTFLLLVPLRLLN